MKHYRWLGWFGVVVGLATAGMAQGGPALLLRSVGTWGVDLADQDHSVRPGDNFYLYQNGGWFARTELGPGLPQAAYWRDLRLLAPRQLIALFESLGAGPIFRDSREAKAAEFYRAYLDEALVEAKGLTPLEPELAAIRAVTNRSELAGLIGRAEGPGTIRAPAVYGPPVGRDLFLLSIGQDQRDPGRYAVYVGQGGLVLPGPEYYLEPQFADIRTAYQDYVAKVLTMIGWQDAENRAQQIVAFETQVAAASWSRESMRDVVKTSNPMSVAELARFAPGFDWRGFFIGAELGGSKRVVIDAKDAFPKIAAIFADTPLEILKARQAFAAADRGADHLTGALGAAGALFSSKLSGNGTFHAAGAPRRVRAEQAAEASVGDLVGALYVARYSSPEAKAKTKEMAAHMIKALAGRIERLTWMSPVSRAEALAKLGTMRISIGFPDSFDNYRGLSISDQDLYGNVTRAAAYQWRRRVRRLNQPFDRSEWALSPEYPNYNYVPTTNTVEIPASLLQPPFFDLKADDAVNYGAIGAQIAQMIVSAFTGSGSQYDSNGRLNPWLTPADVAKYSALASRVSAQYSAIEPLPGMHLKGDLLLDEAVSDLGGIQVALDGYHASLNGQAAPVLDGYTGDQRFFLGRAQMWRAKFGATFVRNQIATGFNAPPFMRVNGPLSNLDAWYEAFRVQPGDKMYVAPDDRVRIW